MRRVEASGPPREAQRRFPRDAIKKTDATHHAYQITRTQAFR